MKPEFSGTVAFLGDGLVLDDEVFARSKWASFKALQRGASPSHLAEFYDDELPNYRREALANAAYSVSQMLHGSGIGDAEWYATLKTRLDANIEELEQLRRGRWSARFPIAWFRER